MTHRAVARTADMPAEGPVWHGARGRLAWVGIDVGERTLPAVAFREGDR